MAYSAQSGHIEGGIQAAVAGSGEAGFLLTLEPRIGARADMVPFCLAWHLLGQKQGFTEELNSAGVGDAGDTIASAKYLAIPGLITIRARLAHPERRPGSPEPCAGLGQDQIGGVLELTGYSICPSRLWLTSIPALFLFWFSKWPESVRLVTWFPDPESAPTKLCVCRLTSLAPWPRILSYASACSSPHGEQRQHVHGIGGPEDVLRDWGDTGWGMASPERCSRTLALGQGLNNRDSCLVGCLESSRARSRLRKEKSAGSRSRFWESVPFTACIKCPLALYRVLPPSYDLGPNLKA